MQRSTTLGTRPRSNRIRAAVAGAAVAAVVLVGAACSGDLVHNYRTFESAVRRGADCTELFDQRARFDDAETLAKVDRDLERIGCTSPEADRTDR